MKISEINEGLLTVTKSELAQVRDWLLAHEFEADSIRPNPVHTLNRVKDVRLGFVAIYKPKQRLRRARFNKYLSVNIARSKYRNETVFLLDLDGIWYELKTVDQVIGKIRAYYKL